MMPFGVALIALKEGRRIRRAAWEPRWWVTVVHAMSKAGTMLNVQPWIGMRSVNEKFAPWSPSHADLLADDWEILPG